MPLAINELGNAPGQAPEAPKIYSESYKHSIVDSTYQNENSLLSMVKGMARLTDYYRQILKDGEEPHAYQPGSGVYQQYSLIKNLVIKFSDESYDFNVQNGQSGKTGSGYVIFGLSPIKGDTFIADIGDGNAGLFTVTDVQIKNFTANKVYQIQFTMVGVVTKAIDDELNSFVAPANVLYYNRDQHLNGGTPLITKDDQELRTNIEKWYMTIIRNIYENFYWEDERTLALISGPFHYYDPYLVKAFSALTGNNRDTYPKVSQFSIEYGGNAKAQHGTYNIWDVLMRGDWNLLPTCNNQAGIVDTHLFFSTRTYGNIRSSLFDGVVVTNPNDFLNFIGWDVWGDNYLAPETSATEPLTYIFSDGFYKGTPQTDYEKLVVEIYRDNFVDLTRLNNYLQTYWSLTPRDQLYQGVIALGMIIKARKSGRVI